MAAWFVRSAIALNILARREENVVCLPVPALRSEQPLSDELVERVTQLHRIWSIRSNKTAT
jgi:hypothetical protein